MATMEKSTAKRGVGRPAFVAQQMLDQVKSAPVGEWIDVGKFPGVTAAAREKILRDTQGNIETEVVLRARRVKGRARTNRRTTAAK